MGRPARGAGKDSSEVMGDAAEGLIDADSRIQERMEELGVAAQDLLSTTTPRDAPGGGTRPPGAR